MVSRYAPPMFRKYISSTLKPHPLNNGERVMEGPAAGACVCSQCFYVMTFIFAVNIKFLCYVYTKNASYMFFWHFVAHISDVSAVVKLILLSMKMQSCSCTLFSCADDRELFYLSLSVYFFLYLSICIPLCTA